MIRAVFVLFLSVISFGHAHAQPCKVFIADIDKVELNLPPNEHLHYHFSSPALLVGEPPLEGAESLKVYKVIHNDTNFKRMRALVRQCAKDSTIKGLFTTRTDEIFNEPLMLQQYVAHLDDLLNKHVHTNSAHLRLNWGFSESFGEITLHYEKHIKHMGMLYSVTHYAQAAAKRFIPYMRPNEVMYFDTRTNAKGEFVTRTTRPSNFIGQLKNLPNMPIDKVKFK